MGDDALAAVDEVADGVGQVELALGVVRLEPLERRPEQVGAEDVDRGVALLERELLGRRVDGLDDRLDGSVGAANDAAVGASVRGLEREHGRGRLLAPVRRDERLEQLRGQQRRVAGEDEQVLGALPTASRAERTASPVPSACSCTATCMSPNASRLSGEAITTSGAGRAAAPPRAPSRPCAGRGSGAGASASPSACACRAHRPSPRLRLRYRSRDDWGARIRTWDHGTKTRCLTAWPRPMVRGAHPTGGHGGGRRARRRRSARAR